MIRVKLLTVVPCERNDIRDFIEKWHYSKSINGVKSNYCFRLMNGDIIVGAAILGKLGMANVWKKYGKQEEDIIEIRRLCCIEETPPNVESYFISKIIKWIRDNTAIKIVLSYADQFYNHTGIIYHASNFKYLGKTSPTRMIKWGDKLWHDKTIRTYYNGKLKPYAQELKDALDRGEAVYVGSMYKHIFIYEIRRKINPRGKGRL